MIFSWKEAMRDVAARPGLRCLVLAHRHDGGWCWHAMPADDPMAKQVRAQWPEDRP